MANNNGWSIIDGVLPDGVRLDTITGKISGKPTEYGEFKATIKIVNPCGDDEREITIIVCAEPKITSENEISFLMGEEDSFQLTSSGMPGVWSIVDTGGDFDEDFEDDFLIGGILPDGLTLDPQTGLISGTATEYGEFIITVKFENICGEDTQEITITVCTEPKITSENEINFVKGEEDSFQLTSSGAPGIWSIVDTGGDFDESFDGSFRINGVLPNGMILNTETGEISGTATEYGEFVLTVKVENICGEDTQKITITVENDEIEKYLLSFNVKDYLDDPVTDAIIVCKDGSNKTLTIKNNGDGTYEVEVPNGTYTYIVSKDGYTEVTGTVVIDGDDENVDVVLIKEPYQILFTVIDTGGSFDKLYYDDSYNLGGKLLIDANIACGDLAIENNEDGTYKTSSFNNTYNYTISKENYLTEIGTVTVEDENVEEIVILKKIVGNIKIDSSYIISNYSYFQAYCEAEPSLLYTFEWKLYNKNTNELIYQYTGIPYYSSINNWYSVNINSTHFNIPIEVHCKVIEPYPGVSSFKCTPVTIWRLTLLNASLSISPNPANLLLGNTFTATCTATGSCPPYEYHFEIFSFENNSIVHTSIQNSNEITYKPTVLGLHEIRCTVKVKDALIEYHDKNYLSKTCVPVYATVVDGIIASLSTPNTSVIEDSAITVTCSWSGGIEPYVFDWSVVRMDGSQTTLYTLNNSVSHQLTYTPTNLWSSGVSPLNPAEVEFRCTVKCTATGFTSITSVATPISVDIVRPPFEFDKITIEEHEDEWKPGATLHATIHLKVDKEGTPPLTYRRKLSTLNNTNGDLLWEDICSKTFEFTWSRSNNSDYVTLYCSVSDNKGRVVNGYITLPNKMAGELMGVIYYNQPKPCVVNSSNNPVGESNDYYIHTIGNVYPTNYSWEIYNNRTNALIDTPTPNSSGHINWQIPMNLGDYQILLVQE